MIRPIQVCCALLFAALAFAAFTAPASAQSCFAPYHVTTQDGRCVWSCAAGTQPDAATGVCVCQPGHEFTDADQSGRIICTPIQQQSENPQFTLPQFEISPRLNLPRLELPETPRPQAQDQAEPAPRFDIQLPQVERPNLLIPNLSDILAGIAQDPRIEFNPLESPRFTLPDPPELDLPEPAPDSLEVSDYARFHPLNAHYFNPCARPAELLDPQYRLKCAIIPQYPVLFEINTQLELLVEKDRPLQKHVLREGEFEIHFARPEDPARNPECNPDLFRDRSVCDATCIMLEYVYFDSAGHQAGVTGEPYGDGDRCDESAHINYVLGFPGLARAYDACSAEASRRNLVDWNHFVTVAMPQRVLAKYLFKDSYTTGSRGNWSMHIHPQYLIPESFVQVSALVQCR